MSSIRVPAAVARSLFAPAQLQALRSGISPELILDTGAKLVWVPCGWGGYYSANGYAADGSDLDMFKPKF